MRKLQIGILDLVTKRPTRSPWAKVMAPNFASIMPQVLAVWCEQAGHDVQLVCYTGFEDLEKDLPRDVDLVFIGAFSQAAQLAYAISNMLRSRGVVTALGGPHARSYPHDAVQYFDYVLGFTDREVVGDLLRDCSPHAPVGAYLSAAGQPPELPGVKERWKYLEPILDKAPFVKMVPVLGSLGCPYTCPFCVDSVVPYQPLSFDRIKEDLQFLRTKFKRPMVAWHDPNFGVRFNDYLDAIEEAVPPGSIDFLAESSLSLLSEAHLKRLKRNTFKAILPGIESWFGLGGKSKTGNTVGMEKVEQVADHINMVLDYVPYLQANFVFGTDMDEGPEPFECTRKFVDLAPGAYPAYCQLSSFGQSAPLNLDYQKQDRILPFPFHFLNTQDSMNVKPKNYSWTEFYRHMIDVTRHTYSARAIYRRYRANRSGGWAWVNLARGVTAQGRGRSGLYAGNIERIENDPECRAFYEGDTTKIPSYYVDKMRRELGPFWKWLPEGAVSHNHMAYLEAAQNGGDLLPLTPSAVRNGKQNGAAMGNGAAPGRSNAAGGKSNAGNAGGNGTGVQETPARASGSHPVAGLLLPALLLIGGLGRPHEASAQLTVTAPPWDAMTPDATRIVNRIPMETRAPLTWVSEPAGRSLVGVRQKWPFALPPVAPVPLTHDAPAADADSRDGGSIYSLRRPSDVILTGLFFLPLALVEPLEGFDEDISNRFHTPGRNAVLRKVGRGFGTLGIDLGLAAATWGAGRLTGGSTLQRVGLHTFETLVVAEVATDGFKYGIGRARPTEGLGSDHFEVFKFRSENNSYPSGHAVHAFAIATTVSRDLHDQAPWVPFVAYPLATWTATTRLLDRRHFPTDIFAGAVLGILTSNVVARFNQKHEDGSRHVSLGLYAPEGGGTGLAVSVPVR